MAIKSSGRLSLSEISEEFGVEGSTDIFKYYADGIHVNEPTRLEFPQIPFTNNTIKFSDFYGVESLIATLINAYSNRQIASNNIGNDKIGKVVKYDGLFFILNIDGKKIDVFKKDNANQIIHTLNLPEDILEAYSFDFYKNSLLISVRKEEGVFIQEYIYKDNELTKTEFEDFNLNLTEVSSISIDSNTLYVLTENRIIKYIL